MPGEIWSTEEKRLLKSLVRVRGLTAKSIAEQNLLPGKSRMAIQKQMGRMRIANVSRSESLKRSVRFTKPERRQFYKLLRSLGRRHCSSQEIAETWNAQSSKKVTPKRVRATLARLHIRRSRKKILSSPFIAKRRAGMTPSTARKEATSKRWDEYWAEERSKLALAAQQRILEAEEAGEDLMPRGCSGCGLYFPPEAPFFMGRTRLPPKTPVGSRSTRCILCRKRYRAKHGH